MCYIENNNKNLFCLCHLYISFRRFSNRQVLRTRGDGNNKFLSLKQNSFVLLYLFRSKGLKQATKYTTILFAALLISLIVFFPALWVQPLATLINIFDEAERIGIRKGHGQILFGEYTRNAGLLFYPLVLLSFYCILQIIY